MFLYKYLFLLACPVALGLLDYPWWIVTAPLWLWGAVSLVSLGGIMATLLLHRLPQ